MQRGELYLVRKPGSRDPKKQRVFVVVSRQLVIDSKFSTVISAPVYSRHDGLSTQVKLGPKHGLKHESSIHCDELVSLRKEVLTHYIGRLDHASVQRLDHALAIALDLDEAQ
jgi:mRNA interferase MazF